MNYRQRLFSLAILSSVTIIGISSCTWLDQASQSKLASMQSNAINLETDEETKKQQEDAYNRETNRIKEELQKAVTFEVYSLAEGKRISKTHFHEQLAAVDYILLGEEHGTVLYHQMQAQLLSELLSKGRKPSVVMEMLDWQDAGLINSTLRHNPNDPDALAKAVNWRNSGWPNWQYYRPIVSAAMKAKTRVIPGNTSGKELMALAIKGGITAMEPRYAEQIGLDRALPADSEQQLREVLSHAHDTEMPEEAIDSMLFAQRLRDAKLAEAIIANNLGDGAVLIAGRQHSRSDYGVPFYLKLREPSAKTVSVVAMTAAELSHWQETSAAEPKAFEYIWVSTPSASTVTQPSAPPSSAKTSSL